MDVIEEFHALQQKINDIKNKESEIDKHLGMLEQYKNDLKRDQVYAKYAYVTAEDFYLLNESGKLKAHSGEFEENEDDNDEEDGGIGEIDFENEVNDVFKSTN